MNGTITSSAHLITMTTLARHFVVHDGKLTGKNDGHCRLCSLDEFPMVKRLKYAPSTVYSTTYHLITAALQDIAKRRNITNPAWQVEGQYLPELQYLAEQKVHAWLHLRRLNSHS